MKKARNRIFFGAPGTGKSFELNEQAKKDFKDTMERVTFYPTYSFAQFVGTYKPVMRDNGISYEYVPGPFIRILLKALKNKNKNYLLIIEELNRANAAAVFGDVFQLLDRDSEGKSRYPITVSEDLQRYIGEKYPELESIKNKLVLPENLYIWATMNSADQGVFPLDTAFKRRWDFEYFGVNANEDKVENYMVEIGKDYPKYYPWNNVRKAFNDRLLQNNVNEDKQLGPFFVKPDMSLPFDELQEDKQTEAQNIEQGEKPAESSIAAAESQTEVKQDQDNNTISWQTFKSKVIMYLFEDAARQCRKNFWGNSETSLTYSNICDKMEEGEYFGFEFGEKVNTAGAQNNVNLQGQDCSFIQKIESILDGSQETKKKKIGYLNNHFIKRLAENRDSTYHNITSLRLLAEHIYQNKENEEQIKQLIKDCKKGVAPNSWKSYKGAFDEFKNKVIMHYRDIQSGGEQVAQEQADAPQN